MRFIIAMTGATGAARDVRLLAAFRKLEAETGRVLSRWAEVRPTKSHGFSARECAIIATRMPAFNGNPKSTDDPSILQSVGRMLNLFGRNCQG